MNNKKADERTKNTAVEMWNNGSSSGQIAHDLGFTRSQVMGIIHRAKKAGKAFSKGSPTKMTPTPMNSEPMLKVNKTYCGSKNMLNVGEGDCRWVVSQGLFCARPVKAVGKSWCEEHHKIVFVPSHRREKNNNAEVLMHRLRFNF